MKKIALFIWALAGIITSCNSDLDVEITTPEYIPVVPPVITYNNAEGAYGGNIMGYGSTYFTLDCFNSTNPNEGIKITGFSLLSTNFASFKLTEGTYNLATTGAASTFMSGTMRENNATGTFLYNSNTNKHTLITGGSFTVALSGNIYTVTTNFTGVDAVTGNPVNDIKINYSGAIRFVDNSIIEKSTYAANGIPKWKTPSGPGTWSGALEFAQNNTTDYYKITNWSNLNITVFCDIGANGTIEIDNYSTVSTDAIYDYYFELGYIDDNRTLTVNIDLEKYDYWIHYNPITKILDFSGTITVAGKTYEAVVGIAGWNRTTNDPEITLSDFYANVKLQLAPVRTSSANAIMQQSNNTQDFAIDMNDLATNHIPVKFTNIKAEKKDKGKLSK